MLKNELLRNGKNIIRILDIKDSSILMIHCTKKSMPKWISKIELETYNHCTEEELLIETNVQIPEIEQLSPMDKKFVHEHYTLIASVLPFIGDEKQRCFIIDTISKEKNISKQTIRNYICLYLVYQNISILAPKQKIKVNQLTKDEKNMRWALNKFYYTKNKNSLTTAYTFMLKERYCDEYGILLQEHPSIHQFKYFYRTHKNLQTYFISRNGLKNYQRNDRPLLGDGVQEFAPNIGIGMFDSTICDIYLVDESGNLVGRPILTACVDAYSGLCCGYTLSWEGGVYSLRNLIATIISDKVDLCKKQGISITKEEWDCSELPAVFVTDRGTEYISGNFEQLTELGITIVNLPSYRPELKGIVEKFFDLIQSYYKKNLKGKGVIEPDFQERGSHDYRKDACLTIREFHKIILYCIIYYNTQRMIPNFPYTSDMIEKNIQPYASNIWNYGKQQIGANLINVNQNILNLVLLPRTTGKFMRNGLHVNKLRYKHDSYTKEYLSGGEVTVAYNPDNASHVWLIQNGEYVKFELIENRYKEKSLDEIYSMQTEQKEIIKSKIHHHLQAQIQLAEHIETIANSGTVNKEVNMKNIRTTRKKEKIRTHINISEGGLKSE
ncbi:MAG: DDE-type integrase/transposase/recombinase [Clostridia bacterium]|nr:DDE-type integrase/transposase/recombinase [Clostridia bacterium]